jgi:hypothetical protein
VGFFPPVSSQGQGLNMAKAGSTIPLKWQLFYPNTPAAQALGFNGGAVTNLNFPPNGYLSIFTVPSCPAGGSSQTDTIVSTEANAGLMNLGNGNYQFNWKTPTFLAGRCLTVTVDIGAPVVGTPNKADILFH